MPITKFINKCRRVQNAGRGKLCGRARKALHQFTTIEQFTDRLKTSFGITGDIFDFYAKLKKLCVKDRENVVEYQQGLDRI